MNRYLQPPAVGSGTLRTASCSGRYSALMNQVGISDTTLRLLPFIRNRCFNPKGFQRTLNTADKPAVFFLLQVRSPGQQMLRKKNWKFPKL